MKTNGKRKLWRVATREDRSRSRSWCWRQKSTTIRPAVSVKEPCAPCSDFHSSTAARSPHTTHARVAVMKFESSHPHPSCPIILHPGHKWRREAKRNTSTGREERTGNEDNDVHVSAELCCRAAKTRQCFLTCKVQAPIIPYSAIYIGWCCKADNIPHL